MPNGGLGQEILERVDHAQPGAENRYQSNPYRQFPAVGFGQWRLNLRRSSRQILSGVNANQHGQTLDRGAELARACRAIADRAQMMLDQRMIDLGNLAHVRQDPEGETKRTESNSGTRKRDKKADGVGFEPTVRVNVRQFSRLVPSTTRPPILRIGGRSEDRPRMRNLPEPEPLRNRLSSPPTLPRRDSPRWHVALDVGDAAIRLRRFVGTHWEMRAWNHRRFAFDPVEVAEILLTYLRVLLHLFGCSVNQHLALIDHVTSLDGAEDFACRMVGDQDADPVVAQLQDDALDRLHGDRVDPGERFIEHDDFRIRDQATRDLQATAFAAAETRRPDSCECA